MSHPASLDFERPLVEIERKIDELRGIAAGNTDLVDEVRRLERKAEQLRETIYGRLTPWQRVQIARHPARPRPHQVLDAVVEGFEELRGDRVAGDDDSVIIGLGYCDRRPVAVLAHGRGRKDPQGRRLTQPPTAVGVRKACRLIELAVRFELPVLSLIDTAEDGFTERSEDGVAQAALGGPLTELQAMLGELPTPAITVILGEAYGVGGLAFMAVERVLMLEHAVCAPVAPETCAQQAFGDLQRLQDVAAALRLTAEDAQALKLCDRPVEEPVGGAHRAPETLFETLRRVLRRDLAALLSTPDVNRLAARRDRLNRLTRLIAVPG